MKLHLGCGPKYIEGWYHIDVVDMPHVDLQHEINRLPMIADNTVDEIYACHVLEHFVRSEVLDVLTEWCRVLRVGGTIRVAVPDFEAVCLEYTDNGNLLAVLGLLVGGQNGLYNFHHSIFDETVLSSLLRRAGFTDIRRYDWGSTPHADLDDFSQAYLPHMDKKHGRLMSLNIEGTKCPGR